MMLFVNNGSIYLYNIFTNYKIWAIICLIVTLSSNSSQKTELQRSIATTEQCLMPILHELIKTLCLRNSSSPLELRAQSRFSTCVHHLLCMSEALIGTNTLCQRLSADCFFCSYLVLTRLTFLEMSAHPSCSVKPARTLSPLAAWGRAMGKWR